MEKNNKCDGCNRKFINSKDLSYLKGKLLCYYCRNKKSIPNLIKNDICKDKIEYKKQMR